MKIVATCVLVLALSLSALTSFPVYGQTFLSAEQIRKLIAGNTVESRRPNGTSFLAYFDPSGKWIRQERDRMTEGTWRINDDGTQCVYLARDYSCARIQENGDGTYTRVERDNPQFLWVKIMSGKAF